jgi:hypothetical protein
LLIFALAMPLMGQTVDPSMWDFVPGGAAPKASRPYRSADGCNWCTDLGTGLNGCTAMGCITVDGVVKRDDPPPPDLHIGVGPCADVLDPPEATTRPPVIRILVVYTAEVERRLGSAVAVRANVATGISQLNRALKDTGIDATAELAGAVLIEREATSWVTGQWERTSIMQMFHEAVATDKGVQRLRDDLEADLVVGWGWSLDPYIAGVSYVLRSFKPGGDWDPSDYGYAVVAAQWAVTWPVFVHEIGHLLGLAHDLATSQGPGFTDYAYGWRDPQDRFRDVMAWGALPILWRYSSATRLFDGVATGSPTADAERVLRYTVPRVACWRGVCRSEEFVTAWKGATP